MTGVAVVVTVKVALPVLEVVDVVYLEFICLRSCHASVYQAVCNDRILAWNFVCPGKYLSFALVVKDIQYLTENAHVAAYGKQNTLIQMNLGGFPQSQLQPLEKIGCLRRILDAQQVDVFKLLVECSENTFAIFDHVLRCGNASALRRDKFTVLAHFSLLFFNIIGNAFNFINVAAQDIVRSALAFLNGGKKCLRSGNKLAEQGRGAAL